MMSYSLIFDSEIKSGRGRPGFKARYNQKYNSLETKYTYYIPLYLSHGRQALNVGLLSVDDAGHHQLPDHQDLAVDHHSAVTDRVQPGRTRGRLNREGGDQGQKHS